MKNIYVVGSINTDLVINTPYMPKAGETLTGSGFFTAHGGKGANQAVAAARLGGKVKMCGCVGGDDFGLSAINALKVEGIDVKNVRKIDGVPTGTAVIIVENGDNRIILDKGANGQLTESDIDKALATATAGDIYVTQLENPIEIIGYGLKKAKEKHPFFPLDAVGRCSIMMEEAGEAVQAANDVMWANGDNEHLKNELKQTAAMCIRILEAMENEE